MTLLVTSKAITNNETDQFPPWNKPWLGIDMFGNIYLGNSYQFNDIKHHFCCIVKGQNSYNKSHTELGGIWNSREWLPEGLKEFRGTIEIKNY